MQQQGFDLCYDKRLYDRLVHDSPNSVRDHLRADADHQQHLVRLIENHDEPRAAATFGSVRKRAAAVVTSTLQGARLYHDGQLDGALTHVPIQLGRGPDELPNHDCARSTHDSYGPRPRPRSDPATGRYGRSLPKHVPADVQRPSSNA